MLTRLSGYKGRKGTNMSTCIINFCYPSVYFSACHTCTRGKHKDSVSGLTYYMGLLTEKLHPRVTRY